MPTQHEKRIEALEAKLRSYEQREAEYQEQVLLYHALIDAIEEGMLICDRTGMILACNPSALHILGRSHTDVIAHSLLAPGWQATTITGQPYPTDDYPAIRALRTGRPQYKQLMGLRTPRNTQIWLSINAQPLFVPGQGEPYAVLVTFNDITRLREDEQALRLHNALWQTVLDNAREAIIATDPAGWVRLFNPTAAAWLGYRDDEIVDQHQILHFFNPDDIALRARELSHQLGRQISADFEAFVARTSPGQADTHVWTCIRKDGGELPLRLTANGLYDDDGVLIGYAFLGSDMTEQQQAHKDLLTLALTDELTGLLNRRGFIEHAKERLRERISRHEHPTATFLYGDLDGLKQINDRWGHAVGSNALRAMADILKLSFRETDLIGRWGGDEFTVLLDDHLERSTDPASLISRVQAQIAAYVRTHNPPYPLGISFGVGTVTLAEPLIIEHLLTTADQAMYQQKLVHKRHATLIE